MSSNGSPTLSNSQYSNYSNSNTPWTPGEPSKANLKFLTATSAIKIGAVTFFSAFGQTPPWPLVQGPHSATPFGLTPSFLLNSLKFWRGSGRTNPIQSIQFVCNLHALLMQSIQPSSHTWYNLQAGIWWSQEACWMSHTLLVIVVTNIIITCMYYTVYHYRI